MKLAAKKWRSSGETKSSRSRRTRRAKSESARSTRRVSRRRTRRTTRKSTRRKPSAYRKYIGRALKRLRREYPRKNISKLRRMAATEWRAAKE